LCEESPYKSGSVKYRVQATIFPAIFPKDVIEKIAALEEETKNHQKHLINVALDYGGRDEILRAVKKAVSDKIKPEEALFKKKFKLKSTSIDGVDKIKFAIKNLATNPYVLKAINREPIKETRSPASAQNPR